MSILRKIYLGVKLVFNLKSIFYRSPWVFVSENKDWSIFHDGIGLVNNLKKRGVKSWITFHPNLVYRSCVHFGSINVFYTKYEKLLFKNNRIFVTFFHGYRGDELGTDLKIDYLLFHLDDIEAIFVSNSIMLGRLIDYGISQAKIKLIPIPIENNIVSRPLKRVKPNFTIGSFQKDGIGWSKGLEPKLIKGPDIFCTILKTLIPDIDFDVLLVGPARGYVVEELKKANIRFEHHYYNDLKSVQARYNDIDVYIMASREEGGPKSILECVAAGVPILCTEVGMAVDVFKNMPNLVSDFSIEDFRSKIIDIYNGNSYKYTQYYKEILDTYSWDKVIHEYIKVYERKKV